MEKRFYVENEISQNFTLQGEEFIHLSKVLRLRVGDTVECFSNNSDIYECKIIAMDKSCATLEALLSKPCLSNPKHEVTLFQALPKLDKLELVTQKFTELGGSRIIPFESKFCIAKQNQNKIERLKKIVVSACKQCGRTKLVEITNCVSIKNLPNLLSEFDLVVFANETESEKVLKLNEVLKEFNNKASTDGKPKKIAYIVGSEGGFSSEEVEKLKEIKNVVSVSLGRRILRTETASIALASIINYELENF